MSAESPTTPGGSKPKSAVYDGSCHCGAVKFTVKTSPPIEAGPVTSCNCSICHINGYLMVYPLEANITWLSGKDDMTSYKFHKQLVIHYFCPTCGTSMGAKSADGMTFADHRAVNIRTLSGSDGLGVDVEKVRLRKVDGRSRD